jgi:hypothetical protein
MADTGSSNMIVWGSAFKSVHVGDGGESNCPTCQAPRGFILMLSYKMHHIWYLVRWATSRQYYRVCGTCNTPFATDAAEVQAMTGSSPAKLIPAFDRLGWVFAAGLIGLFVIAISLSAASHRSDEQTYIAAPAVGDLYEVQINQFIGGPVPAGIPQEAYGIVRIAAVSGGNVTFDLPRVVYDQMRGADEALRSEARTAAYYADQLQKPVADIRRLYDSGVIRYIER